MTREPPIYIPPSSPRPGNAPWLALGIVTGIICIAGLCVMAVELRAVMECLHTGHC